MGYYHLQALLFSHSFAFLYLSFHLTNRHASVFLLQAKLQWSKESKRQKVNTEMCTHPQLFPGQQTFNLYRHRLLSESLMLLFLAVFCCCRNVILCVNAKRVKSKNAAFQEVRGICTLID